MIDLSKLRPAPWEANGIFLNDDHTHAMAVAETDCPEDLAAIEFAALARNAFDVMLRRHWTVLQDSCRGCWYPVNARGYNDYPHGLLGWNHPEYEDPFTALVEADKWLTAQEATSPPGTSS